MIFYDMPPLFRLEAVIHDGQYYTIQKLADVAKVSINEAKEFLHIHKKNVIQTKNSFRVSSGEIIEWYKKNELNIESSIVPGNFPPRIWGGKTESEYFELYPKRFVSVISFSCDDDFVLNELREIIIPYGKLFNRGENKYFIRALDGNFVYSIIQKVLSDKSLKKLKNIKIRSSFKTREISVLPEGFLEPMMKFYEKFALSVLKPHMATIHTFLPDNDDKIAQIREWILIAIQKYDETSGVPFSGYLSTVLNKYPYDLPALFLGKDIAEYQRRRVRAERALLTEDKDITENNLFRKLCQHYNYDDFVKNEEYLQNWNSIKNCSDITNERGVKSFVKESLKKTDYKKAYKLSLAILKAGKETKEYECMKSLIQNFQLEDGMVVSEDFKSSLLWHLRE